MEYKNILIVGAGMAGKLLKEDIKKNTHDAKVIGFVDDKEPASKEMNILGGIDEISKLNKIYKQKQWH